MPFDIPPCLSRYAIETRAKLSALSLSQFLEAAMQEARQLHLLMPGQDFSVAKDDFAVMLDACRQVRNLLKANLQTGVRTFFKRKAFEEPRLLARTRPTAEYLESGRLENQELWSALELVSAPHLTPDLTVAIPSGTFVIKRDETVSVWLCVVRRTIDFLTCCARVCVCLCADRQWFLCGQNSSACAVQIRCCSSAARSTSAC
jgi:hypothetical protein